MKDKLLKVLAITRTKKIIMLLVVITLGIIIHSIGLFYTSNETYYDFENSIWVYPEFSWVRFLLYLFFVILVYILSFFFLRKRNKSN